jgi:hypothetical protein
LPPEQASKGEAASEGRSKTNLQTTLIEKENKRKKAQARRQNLS